MDEETFMGIPRSKIPWHPKVDYEKCDSCNGDPQCLKFCPHDVYTFEGTPKKLAVKNPNNCVVFCRSCRKVCPKDALIFQEKSEILSIIQKIREEIDKEVNK